MLRPRLAASVLAVTIALSLVLAACGDDDEGAEPATTTAGVGTSAAPEPTTTSTGAGAATTTPASTSTTVAATTTLPAGPDADVVLEVVVEGGSVLEGGGRESVPLGSTVALVVTSDVEEEIHLHGYDVELEVVPGVPAVLEFTADIPGVFEVELHGSGLGLWDLEIS
jgi:hypothetical protein